MAVEAKLNVSAEKWHRYALAYDDRMKGYTGEQAIARAYLRNMPFDKYVKLVRELSNDGSLSLVDAELATVIRHIDQLTKRGREVLLERDHADYEKDVSEWQKWQRLNPDKKNWRDLKPSTGQNMLIGRIADTLNILAPQLLNRGRAHDWIARKGGNPRFANNQAASEPEGQA